MERFLTKARRAIDSKHDFRFSQLDIEFDRLLREKRIDAADFQGLTEDKLARIHTVASL